MSRTASLTLEEEQQATREGWGVFSTNGLRAVLEIERIDDPGLDFAGYEHPKFECDESAVLFVRHWAFRGSPLHVKACRIVGLDPAEPV
jgi:hypothetical protein